MPPRINVHSAGRFNGRNFRKAKDNEADDQLRTRQRNRAVGSDQTIRGPSNNNTCTPYRVAGDRRRSLDLARNKFSSGKHYVLA